MRWFGAASKRHPDVRQIIGSEGHTGLWESRVGLRPTAARTSIPSRRTKSPVRVVSKDDVERKHGGKLDEIDCGDRVGADRATITLAAWTTNMREVTVQMTAEAETLSNIGTSSTLESRKLLSMTLFLAYL